MTDEAELELAGPASGLLAMMDRVESAPDCLARRARTYASLGAKPGARVVDVGCGAATALIELSSIVGPAGSARGFDINAGLLAVGRARAAHANAGCALIEAPAESLPVEDHSIDGYRAERLFQHLADPTAAFAEARRTLAPGGRIALVDHDWEAALIESDDLATTRALTAMFRDSVPRGTIGRQFPRLLREAGFVDVDARPDLALSTDWSAHGWFIELLASLGRVFEPCPVEAIDRWLDEQRARAASERFCAVIPWFVATATARG